MSVARIVKLSQEVIDRIAAGEVVQRPSAALKELLENSLDAGATQINVTCQDGGLGLLQIRDDGVGIAVADLPLLCERFATSKLKQFEDLNSMTTFGFRGEALASMSHVARVSVVTRTAADEHAWEAHYDAGVMTQGPSPCAGPTGTTLTVADLFHNTPLRKRAFARSADEYVKICDIVTRYALARPGVGYSCQRVGAPRLDVSIPKTCTTTPAVVANRFGDAVAKHLVAIEGPAEPNPTLRFDGWMSTLSYTGKRSHFTLFVNGRLVGNAALQRAVDHVYAPHLVAGAKSFVILHVHVDPAHIDVNVHPTKHEVLLLDEELVVRSVFDAMKPVLTSLASAREVGASGPSRTLPTVPVSSQAGGYTAAPSPMAVPSQMTAPTAAALGGTLLAPIRARGDAQRGSIEKFLVPMGATRPIAAAAAALAAARSAPSASLQVTVADSDDDDEDLDAPEQPQRPQPTPPDAMASLLATLRPQNDDADAGAFRVDDDDDDDDFGGGRHQELVSQFTRPAAVALPIAAAHHHSGCCEHDAPVAAAPVAAIPHIELNASLAAEEDAAACGAIEQLASVASALAEADAASNNALRDISAGMKYVGQVDDERFFMQAGTTLYLVHTKRFLYEAAYQLVFLRWGRLPRYRLLSSESGEAGVSIAALIDLTLRCDEGLRAQCPTDDMRTAVVSACVSHLAAWAEMLAEYFGIAVDVTRGLLLELPSPFGSVWPINVRSVPLLLVRLATVVDYSSEDTALRGIAREVALFGSTSSADDKPLREAIQESCRRGVKLPAALAADGCLQAIVTVEALYKVFERC